MLKNTSYLKWPWGLYSNLKEDVIKVEYNKKVRYNGANYIIGLKENQLGTYTEPVNKIDIHRNTHDFYDFLHEERNKGNLKLNINSSASLEINGFKLNKKKEDKNYNSYVDNWARFFEELYYFRRDKSKENDSYSWKKIKSFIEETRDDYSDAKLSLIFEIAEQFLTSISNIVHSMNPVLNRVHSLQEISKIKELDIKSMQWISKLPGTSVEEQIGSQKKILSIKRIENYDTYENRIIKDFLYRCIIEANNYKNQTKEVFRKEKRARLVQSFGNICTLLLNDEKFLKVQKPNMSESPSYVILHNAKYRKLWKFYLRLLQLQEERDDLWKWQDRTWAEISQLLISTSLYRLSEESLDSNDYKLSSLVEGEPVINYQQMRGIRVASGCEPGPFLVEFKDGDLSFVVDLVHINQAIYHPQTSDLIDIGARMFIVFNPIDKPLSKTFIVAIWSVNNIASSNPCSKEDTHSSLANALNNINVTLSGKKVYGLVFMNNSSEFDFFDEKNSFVIMCPEDFHKWKKGLEVTLPLIIDELISKMRDEQ